ncbi:hypothetical protein BACCAP_01586 [Pseudoflavonifractor capillosus ATCC 29799]|uniref:Uncharacterized protein n=1 Tax=Pseudoflavonifractor capillosus ATCC 29799 TaxID=411467 RepID=A6NTQ7_9FIRM|nr:hypothetical protein BACCAP_01586 [Pseudoflavonifractor capillosus ATCC 29799]
MGKIGQIAKPSVTNKKRILCREIADSGTGCAFLTAWQCAAGWQKTTLSPDSYRWTSPVFMPYNRVVK